MRYYYFNPFSKQYYFPKGFRKYPVLLTLYQPYKVTAKLMWSVWLHTSPIRYIFSITHPEKLFPVNQIGKFIDQNSILAFNKGSEGVEQKISMLGVDKTTGVPFFIKYGTSDIARKNVSNEGIVLEQLKQLSFVPKIELNVNSEDGFSLIKTSVLRGEKIKYLHLDDKMIKILFDLSEQKIKTDRTFSTTLKTCFAHGDFCVWNMMVDHENIELFDWEMGGQYPLGYDLFTYIFQYEFLVNESMRFDLVINENIDMINRYFDKFQVKDWTPYLLEFSKLKCAVEMAKDNKDLKEHYFEFERFAESYHI